MAKGIYIGSSIKRVHLVNIAPDVSYLSEYSRWVIGSQGTLSSSTSIVKFGSTSVCLTGTTSTSEVYVNALNDPTQHIVGHKYYVSYWYYCTNQSNSKVTTNAYWPANDSGVYTSDVVSQTNTWLHYGRIKDYSSITTAENGIRLDFNNQNIAGSMYFDGLMAIDLTAAFGSGNEPTEEWCKQNIPYIKDRGSVEYDTGVSTARKVFSAYVGVPTDIHLIEGEYVDTLVQSSNVNNYFTKTEKSFYVESTAGTLRAYNTGDDYNNTTSELNLQAKQNINEVSFTWYVNSESGWDKFNAYITRANGSTVAIATDISGYEQSGNYSGALGVGDILTFTYSKDYGTSVDSESCLISDFKILIDTRVDLGVERRDVAHKIKKAFIGVNGKARPVYSLESLAYYGDVIGGLVGTNPDTNGGYTRAFTIDDKAFFINDYLGEYEDDNGELYDSYTRSIQRINNSLTNEGYTTVPFYRNADAIVNLGDKLIAAGGMYFDDWVGAWSYYDTVEVVDKSLTSTSTYAEYTASGIGGATIGDYAIFICGENTAAGELTYGYAFNSSLTKSLLTISIHNTRLDPSCASTQNHAIFAGGRHWPSLNGYEYAYWPSNCIDYYSKSLTHHEAHLARPLVYEAIGDVGNYLLFAGGQSNYSMAEGDSHNANEIKSTPRHQVYVMTKDLTSLDTVLSLSDGKYNITAASLGTMAIFAGGYCKTQSSPADKALLETFDTGLTHSAELVLPSGSTVGYGSGRCFIGATTTSKFVFFGGGTTQGSYDNYSAYTGQINAYVY